MVAHLALGGQREPLGRHRWARDVAAQPLALLHVHPVQQQHLEVDVQIERTTEALDEGHRASAGAPMRGPGLPGNLGDDVVGLDGDLVAGEG